MSDREDRMHGLSKSWFLVEWDNSDGPNTYAVVNWSSLVGQPARSKLCTGKTVIVRRGKDMKQAVIVIMSDDKRFLDTELQQLRSIAAANLQNKGEVNRKRRKLHLSADSPSDCMSTSRLCSPSPPPSNLAPTLHFNRTAPPMTFDQQTQTESKIFIDNNVTVDNSILLEIKQNQLFLKEEILGLIRKTDRLQNSINQLFATRSEFKPLKSISRTSLSPPRNSTPISAKEPRKSSISNGAQSPNENISGGVDSDADYEDYKYLNPLGNSQKMNLTFNGFSNNIANLHVKPWESETYPNDMVPIGSGKTLVPLHVMNQINWTSHSNATRRLMMALFNRHTLATHTLTGKASPAFNGANSKPQKRRLDPSIICDIIETVSKYCGVKESVVRSAITTKCADENKMLRARKVKEEVSNDENKELNDVAI